jgi:hypothetical protein
MNTYTLADQMTLIQPTAKAYSDSIALLMSGKVDFKELSIKLAQQFPTLFVQLATIVEPKFPNLDAKYYVAAENIAPGGNKAQAIKAIRECTGMSLKEARDTVDHAMYELFCDDELPSWVETHPLEALTCQQEEVVDNIKWAFNERYKFSNT